MGHRHQCVPQSSHLYTYTLHLHSVHSPARTFPSHTQPPTLSRMQNEYRSKSGNAPRHVYTCMTHCQLCTNTCKTCAFLLIQPLSWQQPHQHHQRYYQVKPEHLQLSASIMALTFKRPACDREYTQQQQQQHTNSP